MKKIVLLYGIALALLIWLLKWIDYRLLIRDISTEVYVGVVAMIFTAVGIWMGLRLTKPKVIVQKVVKEEFVLDEEKLNTTGISKREYDVLELMARGLSNQEIADQLFISLNTVKTHASNLFSKLEVKRRTQAVQRAKKMSLIP